VKKLFNKLIGNVWVVKQCCFPYPEGYTTYNHYKRTVLDTGLTKEEAKKICDELNK
jgi:hypothetical protein